MTQIGSPTKKQRIRYYLGIILISGALVALAWQFRAGRLLSFEITKNLSTSETK